MPLLLGGLSPLGRSLSGSSTKGQRGRVPCVLASLPGAAWSLAAGRRTLQSRLPVSNMLLLGWLESGGRKMDTRAAPGMQRGRGLFTPGEKRGRGRNKNEILSGVFKSKGKGEGELTRSPAGAPRGGGPGPGGRPGRWGAAGSGSVCAHRRSVGSGADTRRSRCPASAFFKLPCQ